MKTESLARQIQKKKLYNHFSRISSTSAAWNGPRFRIWLCNTWPFSARFSNLQNGSVLPNRPDHLSCVRINTCFKSNRFWFKRNVCGTNDAVITNCFGILGSWQKTHPENSRLLSSGEEWSSRTERPQMNRRCGGYLPPNIFLPFYESK